MEPVNSQQRMKLFALLNFSNRNLVKLLGYCMQGDETLFGVLVLEIVSGKKNRGYVADDHHDNLLGHAWRLYKEGGSLEIVEPTLGESWYVSEVLRSIHIGLLCVQQRAEDRPNTL
ncbi:hypothetical protein Tco_0942626, partial [Tanacetum coccineum]